MRGAAHVSPRGGGHLSQVTGHAGSPLVPSPQRAGPRGSPPPRAPQCSGGRAGGSGPPGPRVPPLESPPSPAPRPGARGSPLGGRARRRRAGREAGREEQVRAAGEVEAEAEAERAREVAAARDSARRCPTWSLRTLPILPLQPSGSPAWIKGSSGRAPRRAGFLPRGPCPETAAAPHLAADSRAPCGGGG